MFGFIAKILNSYSGQYAQEYAMKELARKSTLYKSLQEDYYKKTGDIFEAKIGSKYEKNGFLVIYNGLMRGYHDRGVDLIAIDLLSNRTKEIHLIQCKNWSAKFMGNHEIKEVYDKLTEYKLHLDNFSGADVYNRLQFDTLDLYNEHIESLNWGSYFRTKPHTGTFEESKRENIVSAILNDVNGNIENYEFCKKLFLSSFDSIKKDTLNSLIRADSATLKYRSMEVIHTAIDNESNELNELVQKIENQRAIVSAAKAKLDSKESVDVIGMIKSTYYESMAQAEAERANATSEEQIYADKNNQYVCDVGLELEFGSELVIYNNKIRPDSGIHVDLIALPIHKLSENTKIVRYIKCFLYKDMPNHITNIYNDISKYELDIFKLSGREIYKHVQLDVVHELTEPIDPFDFNEKIRSRRGICAAEGSERKIEEIISNLKEDFASYEIEKILYVTSMDYLAFDSFPKLETIDRFTYMYKDLLIKVFQNTQTQFEINSRINKLRY